MLSFLTVTWPPSRLAPHSPSARDPLPLIREQHHKALSVRPPPSLSLLFRACSRQPHAIPMPCRPEHERDSETYALRRPCFGGPSPTPQLSLRPATTMRHSSIDPQRLVFCLLHYVLTALPACSRLSCSCCESRSPSSRADRAGCMHLSLPPIYPRQPRLLA